MSTIAEKIFARASGKGEAEAGDIEKLKLATLSWQISI